MLQSVFLECAKYMKKAAASHIIIRIFRKSSTADAAAGYLSMVKALQVLLKVHASWELELTLTVNLARPKTASVG